SLMLRLLSNILRGFVPARTCNPSPRRPCPARLEVEALEGRLVPSSLSGVTGGSTIVSQHLSDLASQPAVTYRAPTALRTLSSDPSGLSVTLTGTDLHGNAATWGTLTVIRPDVNSFVYQVSYANRLAHTLGTLTGTMVVIPIDLWHATVSFRVGMVD